MNWNGNDVFMVPTFRDKPYTTKFNKELQNITEKYVKTTEVYGSLTGNLIQEGHTSLSHFEKFFHFLRKKIIKLCNNEVRTTITFKVLFFFNNSFYCERLRDYRS